MSDSGENSVDQRAGELPETAAAAEAREAVDFFESQLSYRLDGFQRLSCEKLAAGSSVLVAAPTGSGKTTVAEFAVWLARRESDTRVFYTAPIKALSNQKYSELAAVYGDDQVGLLTGDVNVNQSAPILVMTTEVLRNMIYADPERLADLSCVVLDEVHFLGDPHRGAVWEEIILHLPGHVRLVGLSATVSNAEELGDWLHSVRGDTEVIISESRPVPLYQHVLTARSLLPLKRKGKLNSEILRLKSSGRDLGGQDRRGGSRGGWDDHGGQRDRDGRGDRGGRRDRGRGAGGGRGRERGRESGSRQAAGGGRLKISRPEMIHALRGADLLPAIVFIFSRNGCDQAVRQCLWEGISLTTEEERQQIKRLVTAATAELSREEKRALRLHEWQRALERGIASHHAGLLPLCKSLVEQLFQQKLVKVVFATETLALGINMPARSVVIEKLEKFNGETRVPLTSGEYTQLTGRAGRRGIDDEGHAIVLWDASIDINNLAELAGDRSYPVQSSFKPTYNMAVNLLSRRSVSQVVTVLERSFAQFQTDRSVVQAAEFVQSAEKSLQGYEQAIARATTQADKKHWIERAKKLQRKTARLRRRVHHEVGSIARQFNRVCEMLVELGYLREITVDDSGDLVPTVWGAVLQRVYGERALLATECLRRGVWQRLNAEELAVMCGVLSYEPRRVVSGYSQEPPTEDWIDAYDNTLRIWAELDYAEERLRLQRTEMPESILGWVVRDWTRFRPLDELLRDSGLSAGDYIRWMKQTVDMLDQLINAAITAAKHPDLSEGEAASFESFEQLAREAKRRIRYGIIENSGV